MKKIDKKFAVVLSGCGYLDGSEITEAVSLLIALYQNGAQVKCFAPDVEISAMDHLAKKPSAEKKNALTEAARIARSDIQPLNALQEKDFDVVVFPGGFGAAKNLSDWAQKGAQCNVLPEIEKIILAFHRESKPIGAICIAPALIARVLGPKGVSVTIGNDKETAAEIEKTGAIHVDCPVDDYITDREHKIVTTPAYMYETTPDKVFKGIFGLARELVEWA